MCRRSRLTRLVCIASEEVIPMAAFIVEELLAVHDPAQLAPYLDQLPAVLAASGGAARVAPTDPVTTLEGTWHPAGIGVMEFADLAQARAWWMSPTFAALQQLRQAARCNTLLVQGFEDDPGARTGPAAFSLTERLAGSWHRDEPDLNAYGEAVTLILERYGARYRAFRTRPLEVLEGSWAGHDQGLTLVEFPDRAHAEAWYDDSEYVPWRELRKAHNTNQIVLCGR
jgi:uncharacterized protein (DUF1330 family)